MTASIKNWAKFQHFKDRKPPWVKLYRDLLDDREWHKLDGDAAKMLVSLWLIGSENSGDLPEIEELAFRLRIDENKVKKCLKQLEHWLISTRYQDDIEVSQKNTVADIEVPLRDRGETETETETDIGAFAPVAKSDAIPVQIVVDVFHEVLPELPKVKLLTDKRKRLIGSFCRFALTSKKTNGERRANTRDEAIGWIRSYFERARENDFLMGRVAKMAGHEGWVCDIDYLISEKGMKQVIEKTGVSA